MEIKNLSIGYTASHDVKVIQRGINARLTPGQLTCLLGPNGAGKTTLLRTLAGFLKPLEGYITVGDKSLSEMTSSEISKTISIVLTDRPNVMSMTASQLVALGRSPYSGFWGKISHEDKEIIEKSLAETGVTEFKDRQVSTLSDGELQKVMIAKALAQSTEIILLDESTAFLDFPSKIGIMKLLSDIARKQNKSILLSTHDVNMALALADNLWMLDRNIGFNSGTPESLSEKGVLQRYFEDKNLEFDKNTLTFNIINS